MFFRPRLRELRRLTSQWLDDVLMSVIVEMHNTGHPELQRDIVAMIEHALSGRPGEWRVSILGSQASDQWEMRILGPNAFERSYMLEGAAGQHEPRAIASIVSKMVPHNY